MRGLCSDCNGMGSSSTHENTLSLRGVTKPYIHDYFRSESLSALLSSVGMEPPCLPPPPSIQGFILETNSCQ